jgi:hypothetical protein
MSHEETDYWPSRDTLPHSIAVRQFTCICHARFQLNIFIARSHCRVKELHPMSLPIVCVHVDHQSQRRRRQIVTYNVVTPLHPPVFE